MQTASRFECGFQHIPWIGRVFLTVLPTGLHVTTLKILNIESMSFSHSNHLSFTVFKPHFIECFTEILDNWALHWRLACPKDGR